jgi:N-acetylglucosamine repressor
MSKRRNSLSSTRLIRSYNSASILQTIYREGSCSRSYLTKVTKMSPSTVTRIISELIEKKVITEKEIGESTGGRKPIIFELNYENLFIVGIQMLRHRVVMAISDLRGTIIRKREFIPYSLAPEELISELAHEFEVMFTNNTIDKERILGIGLAISGVVDSDNGVLIRSISLGWRELKISEILEKALGLPVIIENDANAAALGEYWFGSAKDMQSIIYIKTDTGVGAGIIYEHHLFTGTRGMAGEIGHKPVIKNGRKCRCGQNGCLETYLYLPDVVRRYEEESGKSITDNEQLFLNAKKGDPVARVIIDEAIEALVTAVAFGSFLDLDMVVIGGIWGRLGEDFLEQIRKKNQEILEKGGLNKTVFIKGSELGENVDLLGAVGLVINQWFTPPI